MNNKIFILKTKKSKEYEDITYCIAIFRLGTDFAEFICGETDNDRTYKMGDEASYIYNADYTRNLDNALEWLNKQK
ncbi:hypothetical protein FACS1894145_5750 [Bacteroidia bacterium]|nr:hypothetical protein FACS1894145_5750 [Bacteroidia bacterium]